MSCIIINKGDFGFYFDVVMVSGVNFVFYRFRFRGCFLVGVFYIWEYYIRYCYYLIGLDL